MPNPSYLRELARRCRALLEVATEPHTIEQLRLWAVELRDQADAARRFIAEGEDIEAFFSTPPGSDETPPGS